MPGSDLLTRTQNVGSYGRATLLLGALLVLAATGGVVAAGGSGADGTAHSVAQQSNDTEVTSFVAKSQGGYVAFSEDSETTASEEGTSFPARADGEDPIQIQATVDPSDGTWESENITFPPLTVEGLGLEVQVEVVDGLEGEIDPETGRLTAEGEFRVTVSGASFGYESTMTTADSGDLSGSGEFSDGSGEVTLVDNEFTVEEQTGNDIVNQFLGLPADQPGENWLVLTLDVSLNEEQLEDRSTDESEDETSPSTRTLALTVLGQAFGFVGLGVGVLMMLVTLVARVTGVISLDS